MDFDPLRRAKAYPYRIPRKSYLLADGGHQALPADGPLPDLSGRWPVLAVGSNQSPEQLSRKFSPMNGNAIPVIRARLFDFDTVYSAHFSNYGSVPATLQYSPGTTVTLFINWLNDQELDHMHGTEAVGFNYDFGRLEGIRLAPDHGPALDHAFAYVSRRGCLADNGEPIALAAIQAHGRRWPAFSQEQVLAYMRDRLCQGQPLNEFVGQIIADEMIRRSRVETVEADSQPFAYSEFSPFEF